MPKDKNKSKDKPKKAARKPHKQNDLLDEAARSLRKFRRVTRQMTKLSTGQKLVGGVALLAAGLTYLAKKELQTPAAPIRLPAQAPEPASATPTEYEHEIASGAAAVGAADPDLDSEVPPRKSRKSKRTK